TREVSQAYETYQFNVAMEAIRNFTWHSLADDYLEAIKYRLRPGSDLADLRSAQFCLREALLTICKLLAPICPHISEAIYQQASPRGPSVHNEAWPQPSRTADESALRDGKLLLSVIANARREKSSKGLSLSSNVKRIVVTAESTYLHILKENEETI